jgi:hypothetical protein
LVATDCRAEAFAWANNLLGRSAYVVGPAVVGAAASTIGRADDNPDCHTWLRQLTLTIAFFTRSRPGPSQRSLGAGDRAHRDGTGLASAARINWAARSRPKP